MGLVKTCDWLIAERNIQFLSSLKGFKSGLKFLSWYW